MRQKHPVNAPDAHFGSDFGASGRNARDCTLLGGQKKGSHHVNACHVTRP